MQGEGQRETQAAAARLEVVGRWGPPPPCANPELNIPAQIQPSTLALTPALQTGRARFRDTETPQEIRAQGLARGGGRSFLG